MARGVNKVIIVGRLGNDPETKYMPSGGAVVNISVATNESWTDKNTGQKQERTEWHRVVAFNRLAEIMGQYLRKGAQVYIEGRLQTRKWQDQAGMDRYTTEIIASEMQMLDSRANGADDFTPADNYSTQPAKNNGYPNTQQSASMNQGQSYQHTAPMSQGQSYQQTAPMNQGRNSQQVAQNNQGQTASPVQPPQQQPAQNNQGQTASPVQPPQQQSAQNNQGQTAPPQQAPASVETFDDDVPF